MKDGLSAMYKLRISVTIEQNPRLGHDRLSVQEEMELDATTFMEVAAVLARFHDLSAKLRAEGKAV